MDRWIRRLARTLLILLWSVAPLAQALDAGTYNGRLGPLQLVLHVTTGADGAPACRLDSPNQGALGIPCGDVQLAGNALSFQVPSVGGRWNGTVSEDGTTLTGTWSQGQPMPLVFERDVFVAATRPSPVDGIWLGNLAGAQNLRAQLVVQSGSRGDLRCTMDVPEQDSFDIGCAQPSFTDGAFSFTVPAVDGRWEGRLSRDGNLLEGNWSQRSTTSGGRTPSVALHLARQSQRIERPATPPASFDAAMAPVDAARLEAVLRDDLGATLDAGMLAPGKGIGVAVGVVTRGSRAVFALGDARADALFEIGSINKPFTGLVMAQLVEQGKLTPTTPVRELLPAGLVAKPAGEEITLLDLVTQHSGLPRMPTNLQPRDPQNPYADYDAQRLHDFLRGHGVAKPQDAAFLYSNLGMGLLGHVLARAAQQPYEDLITAQVLQPLGLADTAIALTPAQRARFIGGHSGNLAPAHSWELDALAGAGALRSTAQDMLRFLEANLDPDGVQVAGDAARTLPAALRRSQQPQADAGPGLRIAYAWLQDSSSGTWWHNGGTGGFTSFAFFNPREGHAGIVLVNVAMGSRGSFADRLGQHIIQRLAGKPAVSLAGW